MLYLITPDHTFSWSIRTNHIHLSVRSKLKSLSLTRWSYLRTPGTSSENNSRTSDSTTCTEPWQFLVEPENPSRTPGTPRPLTLHRLYGALQWSLEPWWEFQELLHVPLVPFKNSRIPPQGPRQQTFLNLLCYFQYLENPLNITKDYFSIISTLQKHCGTPVGILETPQGPF